ncbi:helix-turn-helix transcriptional regulator [Sulfitobacter sp. HNIBRBA2951]|uniref:helix-turn-helix transcriptional regulator n=1 Tax=Sulfitobacter aquimarinus TaxID=3158557 RepID=UPI0032E03189
MVVAAIAGLKTFLVVSLLLPGAHGNLELISGLFALFFALTAAVAYLSFTQVRALLERQRKEKLVPGAGEPVAKETVILRNAQGWGLSQAEADVAIFVVKGFSNAEIAEMRGCAIATVKSQLGRIYHKTGLASRYQLIAFVTDEVCSMAFEAEEDTPQVMTRDVLPLVGRQKRAPEGGPLKAARV